MKSSELIADLARGASVPQSTVRLILDELSKTLQRELARGQEVALPGVGKILVSQRVARTGTNPKTGAKVEIPAKRVARLKSSLELRQALA